MQYPKQYDTTFQSQEKTLKREEQSISERERVKLEGRNEAEDENMSRASTLHSLGNLDEHFSPGSTPVKDLLTQSGEKLAQAKETFGEKVSKFEGDIKQKAEQVKSKLTEKFGEEIQPEKDLDPEMKEQVKEINEEIKHHPHGEEQIVEGQGHAQAQSKSFGSKGSDASSQKMGEMKGKLSSKIENLKEGSKEMVDKASGKLEDMKEKANQQAQPLKEQAQNLPGKSYEKEEQSGEKDITKFDDLRTVSKDILDKAIDKIQEMKDTTSQKGEQAKQDIKQTTSQISQKTEQKASELSESQSHHVEAQPGDQPLTKEAKEEILDLAQQITDKVQELKASGQLSTEQKSQSSHFQSQTDSTSPPQEGQEHHHLSAESKSFVPTKQSHQLFEKVKEGLDESVPLNEIVEELEHEKPKSSSQFQERGQPAMESLKQGAQNISNKISEKVQDVKESLAPSGQQQGGFKQESYQSQERGQPLSDQKQNIPSQERGQPALDTLKQGAQDLSNKFSKKVEDIKSNLAPSGQQQEGFKQESYQSQERGQPLSSQMKQGAQEAQNKFYEKKEQFKDKLAPSGQRPSGYQQEDFQSQEKGQPLSGQIKQGVQEASDKLSQKAEDIKSNLAPSSQQEQQQGGFKQESYQSQERGQPFSGQIKQGVQEASNKLSEKMEDVKNKFAPSGQEASESKQDFSQSESQSQEKPATGQLKENFQQASEKLSEKVQEVKQDVAQKKEEILEERKPLVDKIMGRIHEITDNFHQTVEGVKSAFRVEEKPQEEQPEREPLVDTVQKGITDMTSKISHNIEAVKTKVMPTHHESSSQETSHSKQSKPSGASLKEKISQSVDDLKNRFKSEKGEGKFHKVDADEGFTETVEEYRHEHSGPPLVSSNPFETLGTKNLTLAQPLNPDDVVGGNLKELTSNVDTEHLQLNEEYIYHPTAMEKIKEGFRAKFGKGEEEEEAEEAQGSQSLKQKISERIENLKGKFHHGKEEVEQQATEKISEKKPLEHPLESAKQEAKSLKGKAEEQISENKSLEQPQASEGRSFKEVISAPFQSIKGKFHHEKEEVQQQVSEKISEIKPLEKSLEQPLETAKQEAESLKGKAEEKLSENKSFEQPLEQLIGASESRSFKEVIGAPFQSIKGKFHHEKEEVQQQASEKIREAEPLEKSLEQPFEAFKQEVESLKGKAEEKLSENKSFEQPLEQLIGASESRSLKEVIGAPFQSISGKISGGVGSLKSKFHSGKEQIQEEAGQRFEEIQSLDEPSGQKDSGEFHTVKEGIHETVSELKEEESIEPLISSNPFVPLESKAGDIAQPLNPQDIVGGDLQDLTQGVGQENLETKYPEESELTGESKSLLQRISGGFHEGLESMKAKFRKEKEPLEEQSGNISEQFNIGKEKVMSEFSKAYKENIALLGMMKDIEDKCKSSQNEGDENA